MYSGYVAPDVVAKKATVIVHRLQCIVVDELAARKVDDVAGRLQAGQRRKVEHVVGLVGNVGH